MAVTGTVIGALISVPLAFLGCRRICGAVPAALMKLLSAAVRTIPAVIYGLLFLRVTGPGAFAGLMTFAALSVGMSQQRATQDMGVAVLKMAMESSSENVGQLLDEMQESLDPNLGANIDIMA